MESNISDISGQQDFGDLPLAEPRFDEEATMLSARPVVPLETVAARSRRTRTLVVGLTFAGAVLVGMLVAGVYYSRFNGTSSNGLANNETIPSGVEARATETNHSQAPLPAPPRVSVNSDTSAAVTTEAPAPIEASEASSEAPKKPVATRVGVITFPRRLGGERDGGDQERREARREEKDRKREM
ncbi:MAG: hypothetical protein M3R67_09215, partial [Acidobacteriota bacterium]|nr:hypothetical protein [Acidobacteriota bacterium]